MMTDAHEHIDVLVFSGTFYAQTQPKVARMLADAAGRGAEMRLCFGAPDSDAVATRATALRVQEFDKGRGPVGFPADQAGL